MIYTSRFPMRVDKLVSGAHYRGRQLGDDAHALTHVALVTAAIEQKQEILKRC